MSDNNCRDSLRETKHNLELVKDYFSHVCAFALGQELIKDKELLVSQH